MPVFYHNTEQPLFADSTDVPVTGKTSQLWIRAGLSLGSARLGMLDFRYIPVPCVVYPLS